MDQLAAISILKLRYSLTGTSIKAGGLGCTFSMITLEAYMQKIHYH